MAQIGDPTRIITVEPVFEPVPARPDVDKNPAKVPERFEEPVPTERY